MSNIQESLRRAGVDVSRHCRFNGTVALLDDWAEQGHPLREVDYELYFMAWRVTRLLRAQPADTAGYTAPPVATS